MRDAARGFRVGKCAECEQNFLRHKKNATKTTKVTKTVCRSRNKLRYPNFLLRGLLGWHRRLASTDPAAADDDIVIVNHCGLSRRHRALRFVQMNACAIVFQCPDCRNRAGMIVADLYCCLEHRAAIASPSYNMPVHAINFEFVRDQILGVADDDTIRFRVEIDHIARPNRAARKTFALANGKLLNAIVLTHEISFEIVNLAAMKSRVAEMRAQESFVIVAGNETNLLDVELVRDFQA